MEAFLHIQRLKTHPDNAPGVWLVTMCQKYELSIMQFLCYSSWKYVNKLDISITVVSYTLVPIQCDIVQLVLTASGCVGTQPISKGNGNTQLSIYCSGGITEEQHNENVKKRGYCKSGVRDIWGSYLSEPPLRVLTTAVPSRSTRPYKDDPADYPFVYYRRP